MFARSQLSPGNRALGTDASIEQCTSHWDPDPKFWIQSHGSLTRIHSARIVGLVRCTDNRAEFGCPLYPRGASQQIEEIRWFQTMSSKGAYECPVVYSTTLTGQPLVVGVISAGALVERYTIPRRNSGNKTGYQREVNTARVNRLVKDLRRRSVDLPTSILVNLRDYAKGRNIVDADDGTKRLVLWDRDKLHVVDGQHRVEALAWLVDEDEDEWGGVLIPFACMLGADERAEMKQFYVVNSTAKSVPTDLAFHLLKRRAESDPAVMDALTKSGETWKVRGQQLVEDLEKSSSIWRGRVQFLDDPQPLLRIGPGHAPRGETVPGDRAPLLRISPGHAPRGGTVIRSAGLVNSLKSLLATPYFGSITDQNQVLILSAFWEGIRLVIPEAFGQPSDYAVQKSVGVQVLHGLLVSVLEYIRSQGGSVLEPSSYAKAMEEALLDIEGDNRNGDAVRGSDFWLTGAEGAAGSYSSNAGRRVLTAKLRRLLPEIEVA